MTMPKNLIFIRHGYSEANELQQKQNDMDYDEENVTIPDREWRLTETGIQQAKAIGTIFKDGRLAQMDAFFVSPYRRTIETAAHLGIDKAYWKISRDIRERSWGEIDSIPTVTFSKEYPRNYSLKEKDPLYWLPPSGESIAGVADSRLAKTLDRLHRDHAGENVVMVTHHDFMLASRLVIEHLTDDVFTDGMKDKTLAIPNGTALWYSRVNPFTGILHDKIRFVRIITPQFIDGKWEVKRGQWLELERTKYTSDELIAEFLTNN